MKQDTFFLGSPESQTVIGTMRLFGIEAVVRKPQAPAPASLPRKKKGVFSLFRKKSTASPVPAAAAAAAEEAAPQLPDMSNAHVMVFLYDQNDPASFEWVKNALQAISEAPASENEGSNNAGMAMIVGVDCQQRQSFREQVGGFHIHPTASSFYYEKRDENTAKRKKINTQAVALAAAHHMLCRQYQISSQESRGFIYFADLIALWVQRSQRATRAVADLEGYDTRRTADPRVRRLLFARFSQTDKKAACQALRLYLTQRCWESFRSLQQHYPALADNRFGLGSDLGGIFRRFAREEGAQGRLGKSVPKDWFERQEQMLRHEFNL